jgi:cupin superfamily acireductone dioxygenase involved in methionine salvage
LRIEKKTIEHNNNNLNEFIPDSDIIADVAGYSHKDLIVLAKIDPNLPWSFEHPIKENNSELLLEHFISVEFQEQKISYYPSNGYRADYNSLLKQYQYQRTDFEQLNEENTRSNGIFTI